MNNNKNTAANADKLVKIRLTDHTGHQNLEQKIDEAIATVVKEHFAQGKWAFIGARHYQFKATSLDDAGALLEDTINLRKLFNESAEPVVVLTGALQGGC